MNTVNLSVVCKLIFAFTPKNICVSVKSSVSSCRLSISLHRSIAPYHKECSAVNVPASHKYTETIKLCPLDVYVCQFLMYERISFNFLHYKLLSFRHVMHLNKIHLIPSRAADNSENTSTLKIKSHNINSMCVHHNSKPFNHIKASLSKLSS